MFADTEKRHHTLVESRQHHQFLQNHYEVYSWIQEKMQIASDESFKDPTNLKGKLQKHQGFEAELSANKGRVEAVTQVFFFNSLFYLGVDSSDITFSHMKP